MPSWTGAEVGAPSLNGDVLEEKFDSLADAVVRLQRERDEARREMERYDTALAVLEASTDREEDGDGWITRYSWPTGPYHRILGFRGKVLALAAVFAAAERERDDAHAALAAAVGLLIDVKADLTGGEKSTSGIDVAIGLLRGALPGVWRCERMTAASSTPGRQPLDSVPAR